MRNNAATIVNRIERSSPRGTITVDDTIVDWDTKGNGFPPRRRRRRNAQYLWKTSDGAEKESNKLILNQDSGEMQRGRKNRRNDDNDGAGWKKKIYEERTFRVSTIISSGVSWLMQPLSRWKDGGLTAGSTRDPEKLAARDGKNNGVAHWWLLSKQTSASRRQRRLFAWPPSWEALNCRQTWACNTGILRSARDNDLRAFAAEFGSFERNTGAARISSSATGNLPCTASGISGCWLNNYHEIRGTLSLKFRQTRSGLDLISS